MTIEWNKYVLRMNNDRIPKNLNMKLKTKLPKRETTILMGTTDEERCHTERRKNMGKDHGGGSLGTTNIKWKV
jgi:hypothetical protein